MRRTPLSPGFAETNTSSPSPILSSKTNRKRQLAIDSDFELEDEDRGCGNNDDRGCGDSEDGGCGDSEDGAGRNKDAALELVSAEIKKKVC